MQDTVLLGDAAEVLKTLDESSVDLVLTSPPYDKVRRYNGFSFRFEEIAVQLKRVLKPGGVIVWVVADQTVKGDETATSFRQALFFKELGLKLWDTMIFEKLNPPPLTHRRYDPSFEYMFVFSSGDPTAVNLLRESTDHAGKVSCSRFRDSRTDSLVAKNGRTRPTPKTRLRRNVWKYHVGNKGEYVSTTHPAKFPIPLARDHIQSWSNPGDLVLDPFAGAGTTLVAARELKRKFIGIDTSREYVKAMRKLLGA